MIEKRCAIYTRKSTEEGLEQEFNSLDAQHDACEAYIKSQAHEGWKLVRKQYNDGGFSGGTLKRPALRELLEDVEEGKVDVIVVYKIDRLTRSLTDFSKIMDVLDKVEASFAAVTQQFNTTTSMGRLTLNVLLSFAQFEREVTGERIRDKIAASKKKGMWTGGPPPLGYDIVDKKLVVNEKEADVIRLLFTRYLEAGNVTDLVDEFHSKGFRNKEWINKKGNRTGGRPFQRSTLYLMLQNRVYVGEIDFKGIVYKGEHKAIISRELWDAAQAQLEAHRKRKSDAKHRKSPRLLEGIICDSAGNLLSPTFSVKKGNRRYPYYVSAPTVGYRKTGAEEVFRVPAQAIEELVKDRIAAILDADVNELERCRLRKVIGRVTVHKEFVELKIDHGVSGVHVTRLEGCGDQIVVNQKNVLIRIRVTLRRRDKRLVFLNSTGCEVIGVGALDTVLLKGVSKAWRWRELLEENEVVSVRELSRREKCSEGYIRRILPLAFLAPDILESILDGTQPSSIDLKSIIANTIPLSWEAQRHQFGYTD